MGGLLQGDPTQVMSQGSVPRCFDGSDLVAPNIQSTSNRSDVQIAFDNGVAAHVETIQPRPVDELKNGHNHTTKFPMCPDPIMKASLEWMVSLYRAVYNSAVARYGTDWCYGCKRRADVDDNR